MVMVNSVYAINNFCHNQQQKIEIEAKTADLMIFSLEVL